MLSRRGKSNDGKQEDRDKKQQRRREAEKQNKKINENRKRAGDSTVSHSPTHDVSPWESVFTAAL